MKDNDINESPQCEMLRDRRTCNLQSDNVHHNQITVP